VHAVFADATTDGGYDVLKLLSIPVLVLINGLFVAAEFSLVAVRRTRVEELINQGVKGAAAVQAAMAKIERTIAATQLGVTLASIGLGFVGEPVLDHVIHPLFDFLPSPWNHYAGHGAASLSALIIITFLHVTFGELIPKNIAIQGPDRTAIWLARPLNVFARLTRPLTLLMSGTANFVLRRFGYLPSQSEDMVHSVEELLLLIEDTEEAGVLDEQEADLVENVFSLSDKKVSECLVPRDKMAALELTSPPDRVLEAVRQGAHTRMPVYDGVVDNIVGIVNTKDLFYLFSLKGVVVLLDAMYPPIFLKPEESMANALRLFRKSRHPMALVRDEDGKIHGLITLEDVLEEIIGDIEDEHDRPTKKVKLVPRLKKVLHTTPTGTRPSSTTVPALSRPPNSTPR
jgi:CBS domain containing-hemolysin-like protein